tara:strand:- start:17873 stop:18214 length:342 start_codon:yes stop_codon:yes gene_type:complete
MVSQIFKSEINNELLWILLNCICEKKNEYYLINKESFKRGCIFSNKINDFYEELKPYYHESKKHYIENANTYKQFLTVVRQFCRQNNILFRSEIKYMKSTYEIIYYIYYNPQL